MFLEFVAVFKLLGNEAARTFDAIRRAVLFRLTLSTSMFFTSKVEVRRLKNEFWLEKMSGMFLMWNLNWVEFWELGDCEREAEVEIEFAVKGLDMFGGGDLFRLFCTDSLVRFFAEALETLGREVASLFIHFSRLCASLWASDWL